MSENKKPKIPPQIGSCEPDIFPWTPLLQKRIIGVSKPKQYNQPRQNLYPNCDATVWLRSCEQEIPEPLPGKISGQIPKWLNGTLLRNGPGSLKVGDQYFDHLFDSSALLHRFAIEDGKVTYQCRFLQSDVYKKNWKANRIVVTEFGTRAVPDPCHTIFDKISAFFDPKKNQSDNAMISVYPFQDQVYVFTESSVIHRINSESLETEGKVDVKDYVTIIYHTSHPHVMADGSVYNLALSMTARGPYHNIVCFPAGADMFKEAHIVAKIPIRWKFYPSYMHTFGITETYFVIVEQPLVVSVPALAKTQLNNEPMAGCFRWYCNEYTQISLISRNSGKVAYQFYAESFFYLHIINSYESAGHLILDICCYRDPAMLECMYVEAMKNMQHNQNYAKMFRGRPLRFVLPLNIPPKAKKLENLVKIVNTKARAFKLWDGKVLVQPETLCNLGCETPRINYERYLGREYRYFYAISSDIDAENPGTIIKVDTLQRTTLTWCEPNCYPSEPIFVPSPKSQDEDDGVILAAMVWGGEDTNHAGLIVLDAKTFTELGRAEFYTSSPVPKCLHGWFFPKNNFTTK